MLFKGTPIGIFTFSFFCKAYKSLFTHALIHFLAQLFKLIFTTPHILKKNITVMPDTFEQKRAAGVFVIRNETNALCTHTLVFSNAHHLRF